jgi:hypothetical protein
MHKRVSYNTSEWRGETYQRMALEAAMKERIDLCRMVHSNGHRWDGRNCRAKNTGESPRTASNAAIQGLRWLAVMFDEQLSDAMV